MNNTNNPSSIDYSFSPLNSSKPLRWLVTGGCGFIGTSLIKRLISEGGHHIRILDNLSVGNRSDLAQVCDFQEISAENLSSNLSSHTSDLTSSLSPLASLIIGDIKDPETCINCAKDVDVIVHLAANTGVFPSVQDPRSDMEANVMGMFNMLEAARTHGVKRFIFASSGAPVGECNPPIHEELPCHPVSPYGASKLAGEAYCSAYFRSFGIETVALRFGNVYGPGSGHKNSVVAKFIKQAMSGETLEIFGDGSQTRDFIYIDDLIDAIYKAATLTSNLASLSSKSNLSPPSSNISIGGEIFQIATNKETTVAEMTEMLAAILKENGITKFEVINGEKRVGDVMRNFSDTSKAKNKLRWEPLLDLQNGLRETLNYFLESQKKK